MAKINLPRLNMPSVQPASPEQGPVFHQPAGDTPIANIHAMSDGDVSSLRSGGDVAAQPQEQQKAEQLQPVPAQPTAQLQPTPSPTSPPIPIAPSPSQPSQPLTPLRLDDVAMSQLRQDVRAEFRAELTSAVAAIEMQLRRVSASPDAVSELRAEFTRTLHDRIAPRMEALETTLRLIEGEVKVGKGIAASAVARLDSLDSALAAAELPTSDGAKPVLKLRLFRTTRSIIRKPELSADGTSVIIFYNPRPAHEAPDPSEINVTSSTVRNVDSGYVVDVPSGFVCDVFVGSDVVSSVSGRGETELIIPLRTRGSSRFVSAGGEIARLTLRRMERMGVEVV